MMDKAMNKFAFGNANVKSVYFDEENRRHLDTIRSAYTELAIDLLAKGVKKMPEKCWRKWIKCLINLICVWYDQPRKSA